ncbi:MAG: tetratricopeptide repeat protein, partial [Sedimentisphaerales bacterium]|nr:tetratricopeptide repeat protein [Sedimentisphaerales bacterium]
WLKVNQDCYIDPESKLPIALWGYDISYEEPPEDIFDIPDIPDGVMLIDNRPGAPEIPEPAWMKEGEIAKEQFLRARHALAEGQHHKAVELFTKVVEIDPKLNWSWFWLGKAHYELGEYDEAIYNFSKVIDMRTKNKDVPHYCYLARGLAYKAKGMKDMAQRDLSIALPVMIGALRNIKGAFIFDYADDPLLRDIPKDKRPTAQKSLTTMINRLRTVTDHNFGYHPDATLEEKEQAIAAWEEWYENSGQINFSPDAETVHVPEATEEGDE